MSHPPGKPDRKKHAAVCGLYCPGCTLYIGSTEDPDRLAAIAGRFGVTVEDATCYGCRSDVRSFYCRTCEIVKCADEKGVEYCALCDEFPCRMLREFQAERPHRTELFADAQRVREVGYDRWFEEIRQNYTCPSCAVINSAYDLKCRKCGHEPGNDFVEKHGERIAAVLKALADS